MLRFSPSEIRTLSKGPNVILRNLIKFFCVPLTSDRPQKSSGSRKIENVVSVLLEEPPRYWSHFPTMVAGLLQYLTIYDLYSVIHIFVQ